MSATREVLRELIEKLLDVDVLRPEEVEPWLKMLDKEELTENTRALEERHAWVRLKRKIDELERE